MKTFAALLLCLLWITPIGSKTKTDKEREGLAGPVKTVKAYLVEYVWKDKQIVEGTRRPWHTTTYNTEGNITEKTTFENGAITARYVHTYDANGRNTGYEEYSATLDKTLTIPRRHVYTLDAEGRKVEYAVFESDGSIATRFVYKYDTKGNLTEDEWYAHTGQLGGKTVNTYDEKGNQTSQASYQGDGSLNWKNISKYDAKGNRTETLQYYGDLLRYKVLLSYDSKGRLLETETAEFNGRPGTLPLTHAPESGKIVYTYDDDKRTKEVATYEVNGTLKRKVVYAYDEQKSEIGSTVLNADNSIKRDETQLFDIEYDSHGNWTRRTRLNQLEKDRPPQPFHAELRVITYY